MFSPPSWRCTILLCSLERILPALQTLYWSFRQMPALPVGFFYPWNCLVSFFFYSSLKQQHFHWCSALWYCFYSFECTWNLIHLELWVFSLFPRWERWLHLCSQCHSPAQEGGMNCWVVRQWNTEESSRYWRWGDPFSLSHEKPKYFASIWVKNLHFCYVCTNIIAPEEYMGYIFQVSRGVMGVLKKCGVVWKILCCAWPNRNPLKSCLHFLICVCYTAAYSAALLATVCVECSQTVVPK